MITIAFVKVDDGENLEKAIKRFKRMVEKEGIIREWKKREIFFRLKGDIDMLPAPDEVTMEFAGNPHLTD